jgi:hypothetical protein
MRQLLHFIPEKGVTAEFKFRRRMKGGLLD